MEVFDENSEPPFHHLAVAWKENKEIYCGEHDQREIDGEALSKSEATASEVAIYEKLSKKPHWNICVYYRCIRDGNYVGGIVMKKYKRTLDTPHNSNFFVNDIEMPPNVDKVIAGVRSGLDHLHSLGLIYDDVKPANIMIDEDGEPVIVDFDSYSASGKKSRGGTPGWSKYPEYVSFENDEYGFDLLCKFLRGEYDGQDIEACMNG